MTAIIDILPATDADIPALCDLLEILFSQEAEFTPNREAQQQGLNAIIANPELGSVLTARFGGQIAGMVVLLYTISTALGGRVALLEDMIVSPVHRDRGVGAKLLEQAIACAERNGCKRITLLTDQDNHHAQHFYRRHGFDSSPMLPFRRLIPTNSR